MKWTKTWWKRPIPLSEVLGEAVRKGFWPTRERLGEKFGVVFSKTVVVTETERGYIARDFFFLFNSYILCLGTRTCMQR